MCKNGFRHRSEAAVILEDYWRKFISVKRENFTIEHEIRALLERRRTRPDRGIT